MTLYKIAVTVAADYVGEVNLIDSLCNGRMSFVHLSLAIELHNT